MRAIREIDATVSVPLEEREIMKAHVRAIYEQAYFDVSGMRAPKTVEKGAGTASEKNRSIGDEIVKVEAHYDFEIKKVENDVHLDEREQRERIKALKYQREQALLKLKEKFHL